MVELEYSWISHAAVDTRFTIEKRHDVFPRSPDSCQALLSCFGQVVLTIRTVVTSSSLTPAFCAYALTPGAIVKKNHSADIAGS